MEKFPKDLRNLSHQDLFNQGFILSVKTRGFFEILYKKFFNFFVLLSDPWLNAGL